MKLTAVLYALALIFPPSAGVARGQSEPGAKQPSESSTSAVADAPATSDRRDPDEVPVWQEQIIVTPTRSETGLDEIPFQATIVGRESLDRSPQFGLSDVLRELPAFGTVHETSSIIASQTNQAFNLRGVGSNTVSRALVLLDGIPIADPWGGWVYWTQVPMELIERVEVTRGGGSGTWGNLALSGIVSVITRAPADHHYNGSARFASRGTADAGLSYGDTAENLSGWVGATFFRTDGYSPVHPEVRGPIDVPYTKETSNVFGKLHFSSSESTAWRFNGGFFDEDRGDGTPSAYSRNDAFHLSATADLVRDSGLWEVRLFGRQTQWTDLRASIPGDRESETPSRQNLDQPSDQLGVSGVWSSVRGRRHQLKAGVDALMTDVERLFDDRFSSGAFQRRIDVRGSQRNSGIFFQDQVDPRGRLRLLLSGRFDVLRNQDGLVRFSDPASGELTSQRVFADHDETSFNPTLGFVHETSPRVRLRGSAYTGFRAATPSELYVGFTRAGTETAANHELGPERLVGAELGTDLLPGRRSSIRVTGFWYRVEDAVQNVTLGTVGPGGGDLGPCVGLPPGGTCRQRQNFGTTRNVGLEFESEVRPTSRLRLTLGAMLLDGEVTEAATSSLVGNRLSRVPEVRFVARARYHSSERISALLQFRHVGDRWEDDRNSLYLPSVTTLDLQLWHSLTERIDLSLGVTNLLDKEYTVDLTSRGYVEVGAPQMVQVGVRVRTR